MDEKHSEQSHSQEPQAMDEGEVATEEVVELTAEEKKEKEKKEKEEELRKQIDNTWKKIGQQFTFLENIEDGIGKDYVSKLSSSYECVYRQTRDFLKDFVIFKKIKEKLPTLPQRNQHRLIEIKEWRDFAKAQFKVVSVFLKETFYDDFEAFYDDFAMFVGVDKSVEILTALRTFLKGISSLLDDYVDYYKECFPRNTRTVTWDVEA
ncbi:unnamed protein product [Meloidogyne enterolobii]|uniref:Uncharacterized protein n=1 Tax=Meloidogyne enterolobii TaxID=390850 RepID=A0ACB1AWG9_MELEN